MKIVLLPGLDGTGRLFTPFIEALPSEIKTLIISYPPNKKLNYQNLTELVMRQLPDEDFILVGESFSGYVAYQAALRKPKHLKSVIFVATFLESPRPSLLRLFRWLPTTFFFSIPIPSFVAKIFLVGPDANKEIILSLKQAMKQVSPSVLSYRLQEIRNLQSVQQSCDMKMLYIQASNDKLVPKTCQDSFHQVFTDMRTINVEGSHFILQTNPSMCAQIVIDEVKKLERG